jgi:hypothetical protein
MIRTGSVLAAIGALAVATCLSGCVQLTQATTGKPVAIQRDGAHVIIVVCDDLEISGLTMQEREYPDSWQTIWEFDKALSLRSGDRLSPSEAAAIGVDAGRDPSMLANHEIGVFFHVDQSRGDGEDEVGATFLIGKHGLSETAWLRDDGTETAIACP